MADLALYNKAEIAKRLDVTGALISLISSGKYTKSLDGPKAARVVRALQVMERFEAEFEEARDEKGC